MAKTGITYEQVAIAAHQLEAEGEKVTNRAIRQHLGTGSPNVIQRHLVTWREKNPEQPIVKSRDLPQTLIQLLATELETRALAVRKEKDEHIEQLQQELRDISRTADQYEESIANHIEEKQKLENRHNLLQGKYEQLQLAYEKSQDKISELEEKSANTRINYVNNINIIERLEKENSEFREIIKNLKKEGENHQMEIAATKEKYFEYVATKQATENMLTGLEKQVNELNLKLEKAQQKNLDLERMNAEYKVRLEMQKK